MYIYTHTAPVVDGMINQRVHRVYTYKVCDASKEIYVYTAPVVDGLTNQHVNYVYSSKHRYICTCIHTQHQLSIDWSISESTMRIHTKSVMHSTMCIHLNTYKYYMYTHTAPVVDGLINQRVHHAADVLVTQPQHISAQYIKLNYSTSAQCLCFLICMCIPT